MDKKVRIGIIVIIILIISQYLIIQLVYAHKLENSLGILFSKVYNLKAGSIEEGDSKLPILLEEYLKYKDSLEKYLEDNNQEIDINEVVWDRILKNTWLNKLAEDNELIVTKDELNEYLINIEDLDEIKKTSKESFGISFTKYKELVIKPFILESKVYNYLLDNYNDIENVTIAQNAYEALESGKSFLTVAEEYATNSVFSENSMYIPEKDLVDFYEPIKELEEGGYSKIVMIPGGYIIWYLETIIGGEENIREVKQIFIQAKSINQFFEDYLLNVNINKIY